MRQLEHIEDLLVKPANEETAFNEVNKAIELLKLEAETNCSKEKKNFLKETAEKLQIITHMMKQQHLRKLTRNYKLLHNKLGKEIER